MAMVLSVSFALTVYRAVCAGGAGCSGWFQASGGGGWWCGCGTRYLDDLSYLQIRASAVQIVQTNNGWH